MFGVFLICRGPVIYMFAECKGIDGLPTWRKIAKLCAKYENYAGTLLIRNSPYVLLTDSAAADNG